jgi:hypothetical protein
MTYDEESYILDSIAQIKAETHENNLMLSQLCSVVNTWLSHHPQENEDDFMRNVLANLISGMIDIGSVGKNRKAKFP